MAEIIENIATTLKQIFADVPVVTELADDGSFIAHSFLIKQINVQFPHKLANEQMRSYSYDVAYFVDVDSNNLTALGDAADKLMGGMNVLVDSDLQPFAQVVNPSWEIVDKVGHFQFSVTRRMQDDTYIPLFNSSDLEHKEGIK